MHVSIRELHFPLNITEILFYRMADGLKAAGNSSEAAAAMFKIGEAEIKKFRDAMKDGSAAIIADSKDIKTAMEEDVIAFKEAEAALSRFKQGLTVEAVSMGSGLKNFLTGVKATLEYELSGKTGGTGGAFGAGKRAIAEENQRKELERSLMSSRKALGFALNTYNQSTPSEQKKIVEILEDIRTELHMTAVRSAQVGGSTEQDPIFETH